jgi:membrane carboxypeptidase/penicillin-binding protein PbpC
VLGEHGEQIAYLLTDILSDNHAREYMFGPGNVMELPDGRAAAVKTGTSNDWKDSWAVGFTPDITVGVWVGNSDSSPMQEVAGVNGAGTIWRAIMDLYDQGRSPQPFARPAGISSATICADTGALAGDACPDPLDELFIAGTEPKTSDVVLRKLRVAGDGSCLAASYTPADQVHEQTFVAYPPEFHEWAVAAGIPQPPAVFCPPPLPNASGSAGASPGASPGANPGANATLAAITQPTASAPITLTQVFVRGSAHGAYTLEFGSGRDPESWQSISGGGLGVTDGILGVWQTSGLAPGEYTLRLRVAIPGSLPVETKVVVRVGQ